MGGTNRLGQKLGRFQYSGGFDYPLIKLLHGDGVVGVGGDLMPQSVSNLNRLLFRLAFEFHKK